MLLLILHFGHVVPHHATFALAHHAAVFHHGTLHHRVFVATLHVLHHVAHHLLVGATLRHQFMDDRHQFLELGILGFVGGLHLLMHLHHHFAVLGHLHRHATLGGRLLSSDCRGDQEQ